MLIVIESAEFLISSLSIHWCWSWARWMQGLYLYSVKCSQALPLLECLQQGSYQLQTADGWLGCSKTDNLRNFWNLHWKSILEISALHYTILDIHTSNLYIHIAYICISTRIVCIALLRHSARTLVLYVTPNVAVLHSLQVIGHGPISIVQYYTTKYLWSTNGSLVVAPDYVHSTDNSRDSQLTSALEVGWDYCQQHAGALSKPCHVARCTMLSL